MMVESASWDDWSASNAAPINDDEKWHVALAPGEVKIVSLEQLDDLFRLSIVDSETKVWQDGMAEWQPLGVIAGIEDKTVPEPKRTHPKPPSPRSSPPPAPRRSVPSPPRPASRAPAAAASFYPQAVASASFYPEPLVVAPIRTVTPLTSVRPLVVSQQPHAANQGGGFGRFLIGLAAVAGVSVTLYRNGVVREAATSVHQEALYARLEASLGGPAFGTLRAVEQATSVQAAAFNPNADGIDAPADVQPKAAAAPLATTTAQPTTGTPPPVVSLESLAPEKAGVGAKPEAQGNLAARPTVAPTVTQPKLETTTVAKSSPAVKSAPAKAFAEPSAPVAKATPKAAPVEKAPPPVAEKPASQMTDREKLNAAISKMMSSPLPSGKSSAKGKSNEYDPLNPKL
jgi:uncharacterized protein DUF4339